MDILGDFAEARLRSVLEPGSSPQTTWPSGRLLVLVLKEGQPQMTIPGKYTVTSLTTNGTPSAPLCLGIHTHTDAGVRHAGNQSKRNSSPWARVHWFAQTPTCLGRGMPRPNACSVLAALLTSILGGKYP